MTGTIQNIQNEEYYKLVADNINDLVALYSADGILEYISPSVYRILGWDEGSLTGSLPNNIVHPGDHHLLSLSFPAVSANNAESIAFEYRLLHKNGNWIYFDSYRKPIRDNNGNLVNILAVCRDISYRKHVEQEIRENELLYRMLADNIIDMVALYKTDGTTLYVSPSSFSLLGYLPEELTGRNIALLVHPDDMARFRNDIRHKAYKGIEKFSTEARLLHKNGTWLYCETTTKAVRDAAGRVHSFVCTTRDITEWKLAQIALKNSEEKYRSLVDSSEAMISIVDIDGRFLFANDKRAEFFNTPKQDIIGKSICDFYGPKDTADFKANVHRIFELKQSFVYEANPSFNGVDVWLRVNMHPVFNAAGDVTAILVNTIDITRDKAKEEALRAQNEELKKIAFLQSHIVRSPLTNIQGIVALMEHGELNEEQTFYLSLLKQATSRLDLVVKEIVDRAVAVKRNVENL